MNRLHKPLTMLVADDDEDDQVLMQEAIKESKINVNLHFVEDGEELLHYLKRQGKYSESKFPRPSLILLDLNMPKKDGREVLKEIKSNDELRQIPVVIFTTSKREEDVYRSYNIGGNSFITKPVTFEGLVDVIKTITEYWFDIVELPNS